MTDDRKEDWWWKSDGKTLGPRPELVQEIAEKASVPFYMYQADRFLEFAKEFLNQDIEQSTIDEIKQLREERETKEIEAQAAIRATSRMLAEAVVEKASEEGLRSSSLELQARPVSFADVADAWRFWSDPENQKAVKNALREFLETYREAFRVISAAFNEKKLAALLSQELDSIPQPPTSVASGRPSSVHIKSNANKGSTQSKPKEVSKTVKKRH